MSDGDADSSRLISEIMRSQIRGFKRNRVPAVDPFKPLPIKALRTTSVSPWVSTRTFFKTRNVLNYGQVPMQRLVFLEEKGCILKPNFARDYLYLVSIYRYGM